MVLRLKPLVVSVKVVRSLSFAPLNSCSVMLDCRSNPQGSKPIQAGEEPVLNRPGFDMPGQRMMAGMRKPLSLVVALVPLHGIILRLAK